MIRIVVTSIILMSTALWSSASPQRTRKPSGPKPPLVTTPVTMVSSATPEYLSGEANVTVKGNENPIVRLGLAQSGVSLVEFPSSDRFFALHPGNSEMVTIDNSPTKARDHFFVYRAGSGFITPPAGSSSRGPSASIIVQMRSGMVVTFLIYPVRELSQMAHRVVVMYNREEVIASRKAAGLAVNLDDPDQAQSQIASMRIDRPDPVSGDAGKEKSDAGARPRLTRLDSPDKPPLVQDVGAPRNKKEPDLESEAQNAIKSALKSSSKIKNWSDPLHGISVATASSRDLTQDIRLVVVAVRNTINEPIRIVPGFPEITIETRDDRDQRVLVEQVKKLHVASSGLGGEIPAAATVYYAVVYQRPILGARQHLRVAVGQINAADEPATTDLAASAR